jgi:hypothetical protein
MIYDHDARIHKLVYSQEELNEHLADGWRLQPFPAEASPERDLDPADAREVAEIEKQIKKPRK